MSHGHIRESKPRALISISWWRLALCFASVVIVFVSLYLVANWIHSFPSTYETANGKILGIRKVVDGTIDSQYGGKILYGFEAHVQYVANGQSQDRWLRASDDLPREGHLLS
jgi:hypothetical protein